MGYGGNRKDAGKALGKSGDGGIDGIINEDRLGLDARLLTIQFPSPLSFQHLETAGQCLQFLYFRRGRCPEVRFLRRTKMCNDFCVFLIGLVAPELAGAIGFDACRIDDTHSKTTLMQEHGHRFAIAPSGFNADVTAFRFLLLEPVVATLPIRRDLLTPIANS